ncbi:MAG: biotin/lipoate A/B protein ligase family protein [Candidatus Atabeyarchaeum deiterrae]
MLTDSPKSIHTHCKWDQDNPRDSQTWRLLELDMDDPLHNLAVEEAVLENVSTGEASDTIRFWKNTKPTIVIGKFQMPELEVNREICEKQGISVVRRFTGGGAVYHDRGNLNYALSARRGGPIVPSAISEIIPTLCGGVVEGLRTLGLDVSFVSAGAYCQVNGKKISGTAAVVRKKVAFVHGTVIVSSDLVKMREALDVPPYPTDSKLKQFVKSIRREVTSIELELGRKVPLVEVKEALKKGFIKSLGISLKKGALLQSEQRLANRIAREKRSEIIIC